jgi:hypothetical protein
MRPTQVDSLLSILLEEGEIASDNSHKLIQQQQELQQILTSYQGVFEEHVELPTKRETDGVPQSIESGAFTWGSTVN